MTSEMNTKFKDLEAKQTQTQSRLVALEEENKELRSRLGYMVRKNNLILHGIKEDEHKDTLEIVQTVLQDEMGTDLDVKDVQDVYRMGKPARAKNRPIMLKLVSEMTKVKIFRVAKTVKPEGVFVCEDLSEEDRKKRAVLTELRTEKRNNGYTAYIKYKKLFVVDASDNKNVYVFDHKTGKAECQNPRFDDSLKAAEDEAEELYPDAATDQG